MQKTLCIFLCFIILLGCTACKTDNPNAQSAVSTVSIAVPQVTLPSTSFTPEDQFTQRDLLENATDQTVQPLSLPTNGQTLTIDKEGVYGFQGEGNGQILVNAPKEAKIQLIFNGVTLHGETTAPVYIKQANKVFLTLEKDSSNFLSCGETLTAIDENNIDGVIFAKDDLTVNGQGSLTVTAPGCHGIVAKDDMVLSGVTLSVTAKGHGITANNSVRVASGNYTITSQKDGVKAEHDQDTTLGYLYIQQGQFTVNATGDGFSSSGICQIENGNFTLTTAEKGIKSANNLLLKEGAFTLNSQDDCLHANGDVAVTAGSYLLESGDDGVHADGNLTVTGGTITVKNSYEALEGHTIAVTGGTHTLIAHDDGMNSAGGNDQSGFGGHGGDQFAVDENAFILISGGKTIINAGGDGVDSNGTLTVTGGETYIYGPVNGGNSAIDAGGTKAISGGIVVALGTAEMAETFNTASQGAALVSINGNAGEALTLKDSSGNTLLSCTPEKGYQCAVISCPNMVANGTYTLTAGNQTAQFTLTDFLYGQGMGTPGTPGGGRPGGTPPGGGAPPPR